MNSEDKIDEILEFTSQCDSRLDTIEKSLSLLLTQNMLDEYKKIIQNQPHTNIIHIFFNCDEDKSPYSMNILYNNLAYDDSIIGRELLMDRIIKENRASTIKIEIKDIDKIKQIIFQGRPSDASKYLKYGCIVSLDICQELTDGNIK